MGTVLVSISSTTVPFAFLLIALLHLTGGVNLFPLILTLNSLSSHFSGKFKGVHCILCLDGNFAHKRCGHAGKGDQLLAEPHSFFIPEDVVADMEREVESKRGAHSHHPLEDDQEGLMALVCHHDRIIFMVNLHDAGEKQYNALAIIKQLFIELPPVWNVGILYDIGCQLHKSIKKVCFT